MANGKHFSDRCKNLNCDVAEIIIDAISRVDQKRVYVSESVISLSETETRPSIAILELNIIYYIIEMVYRCCTTGIMDPYLKVLHITVLNFF